METTNREPIAPYDFRHPLRIGNEQLLALERLHEDFCQSCASALSAQLRTTVAIKLTGVSQCAYGQYIFCLENPTCFNVVSAEPLDSNLMLDISPAILCPMIDRLLGGSRDESPGGDRGPLTEIDLRLAALITGTILEELRLVWKNVVPLRLEVVQVAVDPQQAQGIAADEVVATIGFDLSIGDLRGAMNLGIPHKAIERIGVELAAGTWPESGRRGAASEGASRIGRAVRASRVQISARLAQTQVGAGDLLGLRVGDIITTQKDAGSPIVVAIEDIPKFRARPGAFKGRKAVLIESLIENPADAQEP